jgi:hypothetical protein
MAFGAAVLLGWTLLGGLDALNATLRDALLPAGAMAYQLALLAPFTLIGALLDLPLRVVQHLPHRAALRLQPHDAAAVRGRPGQGRCWWAR